VVAPDGDRRSVALRALAAVIGALAGAAVAVLTAGPIEYDPESNDFDFHDTDEVQDLTHDDANDHPTPAVFRPECPGL
jgi:hypothetical protein